MLGVKALQTLQRTYQVFIWNAFRETFLHAGTNDYTRASMPHAVIKRLQQIMSHLVAELYINGQDPKRLVEELYRRCVQHVLGAYDTKANLFRLSPNFGAPTMHAPEVFIKVLMRSTFSAVESQGLAVDKVSSLVLFDLNVAAQQLIALYDLSDNDEDIENQRTILSVLLDTFDGINAACSELNSVEILGGLTNERRAR